MIKYLLCDIEGTTTPITFVHDVLFPYAYERLPQFVSDNQQDPAVKADIEATISTVAEEDGKKIDEREAVQRLQHWIKEDRKHPALKSLQGKIWKEGYESRAFTSVVFDDVIPNIKKWLAENKKVGIYSSGSVQAQKLLFGHTQSGDINPLLSNYFDTGVGGKKDITSYNNIIAKLNYIPSEILFLSDVEDELMAAEQAGMRVIQLVRPGTTPSKKFTSCADFHAVNSAMSKI